MQKASNEAIGLDRIGKPKPKLSSSFSESDSVKEWQLMLAASASATPGNTPTPRQIADAFDRVAYGVRHGLISIDYVPADAVSMDIPHVGHPHYMQAMVYWCVRLDCTLTVLCEAHARLGRSPSITNAQSAVQRVAHEETPVARQRSATPATVPMFERTRPYQR